MVAACVVLAACGGGGGGGGGSDGGGSPPGGGTPPPGGGGGGAAVSFVYESLAPASSVDAFLANLNNEGARGFAYLSDLVFLSGSTVGEQATAFVKDTSRSDTFSYEQLPLSKSSADFVASQCAGRARLSLPRRLCDQSAGAEHELLRHL
jgi:hypothetical protein